jgi:coproporphyrinogen III oxidase
MPDKTTIATWFQSLQDDICSQLETTDGKATFREDLWQHHSGGGGRTRVIEDGAVLERGGVNFSGVEGIVSAPMLKSLQLESKTQEAITFFATGVSLVEHPRSPRVPIVHMNVRYFEMSDGLWWFGGGIDLTPIYVLEEDARFFHQQMKETCDRHSPTFYPEYKKWADEYFYLKHRNETRGIGGIFFDRHNTGDFETDFAFTKAVGEAFLSAYPTIVRRRMTEGWDAADRAEQLEVRGLYVEFNLLYDRGTTFGLRAGGNVETILSSMPPAVTWG